MVQFIQPRQTEKERFQNEFARSFGGNLGQSLSQGLSGALNDRNENETIKRLTGKDLSGLGPDLKKSFAERLAKSPEHEQLKQSLIAQGVSPRSRSIHYAHSGRTDSLC